MIKAERDAYKTFLNDLLKQGIDKETVKAMTKTFVEYKLVKPVVYSN